jgi:hypothetical protein
VGPLRFGRLHPGWKKSYREEFTRSLAERRQRGETAAIPGPYKLKDDLKTPP